MKRFFYLLFFAHLSVYSQNAANDFTVPISAQVSSSTNEITLNWTENTGSGNDYYIYRKNKGVTGWGSVIDIVPVGTTSYLDSTVILGASYEYLIQKRTGGTLFAWGYISSGIEVELTANRGDILVLVDSTHIVGLSAEITQLTEDLYHDGWMPKVIGINPSNSSIEVKAIIQSEYSSLPDLQSVYLLGHIPVPYSGNLYPDAHANHEGAWPADTYYGDLDGNWTDVTINNIVASDTRNHNIPGDGKFDQSMTPTQLELEICRVDFYDLPVYATSEEDLLRDYLNRAHDFKIAGYVPQEKALYDQGGFTGMAEGFAQNGIRNFVPFVGSANISEIDYFTALTTESYLWSYGCGAGSYTSVGALDNGTSLTSAELAATPLQATFTMLFGSYFGDWDKTNNIMRAALASGNTLSVSWAGRPNWHYHQMAMGDHLGGAAKTSMDVNTDYISLQLSGGFVTGEGVHMAQLGDPSVRTYYVEPPSLLTVANVNNEAILNWTASPDAGIDGYNLYRRTSSTLWTKVNTSIVTATTFTDATIPNGDMYEYMVKAVKLKINSSGSFFNESLGTVDSEQFSVGLSENNEVQIALYPNPAQSQFSLSSSETITSISIVDLSGKVITNENIGSKQTQVDVSNLADGLYIILIHSSKATVQKQFVKH